MHTEIKFAVFGHIELIYARTDSNYPRVKSRTLTS